jgi:hypothetical protein
MPRTCVFTITTGRSGTMFLAELLDANLPGAEVYHEILDYGAFGAHTPDVSDMRQFNAFGNNEKVQSFWRQKLLRIAAKPVPVYVETAHMLAKAGLMENLALLADETQVCVVLLRRDVAKIVSSMLCNGDFVNKGDIWLWYLDPDYPRAIVDPTPFRPRGRAGIILWYVCEMLTRAEYYRLLLADAPWIRFVDAEIDRLNDLVVVADLLAQLGYDRLPDEVVLPPPQNAWPGLPLSARDADAVQRLVEGIKDFAPRSLAEQFLGSGRRLAEFLGPPVVHA